MTTETINETFEEASKTFNDMLNELGIEPLVGNELKDWGVEGGKTNAQLQELANDLASEIRTERCAAKDAWRYEV